MANITCCAADGDANLMSMQNGCLKLMKDAYPDILTIHVLKILQSKNTRKHCY